MMTEDGFAGTGHVHVPAGQLLEQQSAAAMHGLPRPTQQIPLGHWFEQHWPADVQVAPVGRQQSLVVDPSGGWQNRPAQQSDGWSQAAGTEMQHASSTQLAEPQQTPPPAQLPPSGAQHCLYRLPLG
jgi:hypothetical protein